MEVFPIVSRPLATIQDIMINVYLTTASRINFDIKEILVRLMLRYGAVPPTLFTNLCVMRHLSTCIVAMFLVLRIP